MRRPSFPPVTPAVPPSNITLTATKSGNNLAISWTPTGGNLQSTPELKGTSTVWSDAGTANPTTITIGATGQRFYRVKQ